MDLASALRMPSRCGSILLRRRVFRAFVAYLLNQAVNPTHVHSFLNSKEHIIMHTDETSVRVDEYRGQIWVTRLQDEAYHKDYVNIRYRGYTELIFWAAYTSEIKDPSYIFSKETAAEKN